MDVIFSTDNFLFRFLSKVADMLWLSILTIICSLPIVTIGPSLTALYYVTLKLTRDEEGYITKQFFKSFRENLKQGFVIGILFLLFGGALGANMYFYAMDKSIPSWLIVVIMACAWIYLLIVHYVFAVLSRFENTVSGTIIFAFVLSVKKIGWSLLMIFIFISVVAFSLFVFLPTIFFIHGICAFIDSYILNHVFKPYVEQATKEQAQE